MSALEESMSKRTPEHEAVVKTLKVWCKRLNRCECHAWCESELLAAIKTLSYFWRNRKKPKPSETPAD